jgi:hypothetical protein
MPIIIMPPQAIMHGMPAFIMLIMRLQASMNMSFEVSSIGVISQTIPSAVILQVILHIMTGIGIMPDIIGIMPFMGIMPFIIGIMPDMGIIPIPGIMPIMLFIMGMPPIIIGIEGMDIAALIYRSVVLSPAPAVRPLAVPLRSPNHANNGKVGRLGRFLRY